MERQNIYIVALSIIIFCSLLFNVDGDKNETTTTSSIDTKITEETTLSSEKKIFKEYAFLNINPVRAREGGEFTL